MIALEILLLVFIYDFIGFVLMRKLFAVNTKFYLAFGFIFSVGFFQLLTLPFLYLHSSFNVIKYFILPLYLIIILILLFKYGVEYVNFTKKNYRKRDFFVFLIISILLGIIIIILTVTEIDQTLYATLTTSTINSNIIYFSSGYGTIWNNVAVPHGLNSLSLYNAMIMNVFNVDIIDYQFGAFRIIEALIFINIFAYINEKFLRNKIINMIVLCIGLIGFSFLSPIPYINDSLVLMFSGNSGTLFMFVLMGPIMLSLFSIEKHKILYFIFAIVLFSFAITYSLILAVFLSCVILSIIYKNDRYLYIGIFVMLYQIMFYAFDYWYLFVVLMLLCLLFEFFLKRYLQKINLSIIIYVVFCLLFLVVSGPMMIISSYANYCVLMTLILLIIYYKNKFHNLKYFEFCILFLIGIFCFGFFNKQLEFEFMVIQTRSLSFIFSAYLILFIINETYIVKKVITIFGIISVFILLTFGNSKPIKINSFVEYYYNVKEFGSHRQNLIANKDVEKIIKYEFEINSDILIYNLYENNNGSSYSDNSVYSINKYIGVSNIFKDFSKSYCTATDDCYLMYKKFNFEGDGTTNVEKLESNNIVFESNNYYILKFKSREEVIDFLKFRKD